MRSTKAIAGALLLALVTLAGCGTTEKPSAGSPKNGGVPVTVTDSRGKTVQLPHTAKRVVATEWNAVEDLVSLGVMPVGVADPKGYGQWVSAAPLRGAVKDIGTRGEPSLDTLMSLAPDLVVVTEGLPESALAQIEAKLPVVVIKGGDLKDSLGTMFRGLNTIATATGTENRATKLKSEFDAKLAEDRNAVEGLGATGEKVAFADAYVASGTVTIRPYTKGSQVSEVFARLGLGNPWPMTGDPAYGLGKADVEGLTRLPDVRFWYSANDSDGDPFAKELANNAIWKGLPFVKGGKVQRLPDSLWMFGGPKSMQQYADAAVAALKK
ncbi:iron-siderophore ABC transporter substrate-binding protein [Sciscionella marina]|uniref:ABC transporter substrate-binding protein n=1 Tax=Sciscionella marina TaxID=508770 RepID=UPI00036CAE31|nr:iron-siderophore ABC transporter substrate-binding protein [Sciscionella marina]